MELCLGTAQLGMDYGIANQGGKPTSHRAEEILERALSLGVKVFDTAAGYGTAEELVGNFAKKRGGDFQVVTKVAVDMDGGQGLERVVEKSLNLLKPARVSYLMLHRASDLAIGEIREKMILRTGEDGDFRWGVSIYTPKEGAAAAVDEKVGCMQIPYNVFDNRLEKIGFFDECRRRGKTIFARSALLQGLLLMDIQEVEKKVPWAARSVAEFQRLAQEGGYGFKEAAIQYVKENEGIDYLVFGADSVSQLEEFVETFEGVTVDRELNARFRKAFHSLDEKIINPALWNTSR